MFSFNKFIASAGLATAVTCATMWASASPTAKLLDDPAFRAAQADVENAPEFCAVTYIMRDYTRGWVAVCELDTAAE